MCQKLYSVNQHNSDRQNQSALSRRQVLPQYSLGGISPSGSIPQSYLPHTVEGIYPKGGRPCPRVVTTTEQRGGYTPCPIQALVIMTTIMPLSRGYWITQREKMWQASILKTVFEQKYYTHEGYTGTLPYKNHPCRPWR